MSVLSTSNEEDIYFNFINSLKSDVTKKTYEREIKKFVVFCDIEKLSDFLYIEPQKQIVKYLMSEREKGLSFNSRELRDGHKRGVHNTCLNGSIMKIKKILIFKGK